MSEIRDHRDLEAWRVAMDAVLETYRLSADLPKQETYGLISQMRRAAVSVPSNVAKAGLGRPRGDQIFDHGPRIDGGTRHAGGGGLATGIRLSGPRG